MELTGDPFGVVATTAPRRVVVSYTGFTGARLAVLAVGKGRLSELARVPLVGTAAALGMAVSPDGRWLAVTTFQQTLLLSAAQVLAGDQHPVSLAVSDGASGQIEAAFSGDGRYLFVSDESSGALSVFDLAPAERSRLRRPAVFVGRVPLALGPVGLALSPDGRWLYATSEGTNGHGVLSVIAVSQATRDPARAVIARVAAGCQPVRVALSGDGRYAWVTARGSNDLLGFDTASLRADKPAALRAVVRVGLEPVGVGILDAGRYALVADSGRFLNSSQPQTLALVDLSAALAGRPRVDRWFAAGEFPREVVVSDQTAVVTNFDSDTVESVALSGALAAGAT